MAHCAVENSDTILRARIFYGRYDARVRVTTQCNRGRVMVDAETQSNDIRNQGTMPRRGLGLATLAALAIIATGCERKYTDNDGQVSEDDDCPDSDDLGRKSNNDPDLNRKIARLASAIDHLRFAIARFSAEDWKTVILDVESAANDVEDTFGQLRKALVKG